MEYTVVNWDGFQIHSLKRVSDGKLLTVGDTVEIIQVPGEEKKISGFVLTNQLITVLLGASGAAFLDHIVIH